MMKCPRCNHEWDARAGACANCGLAVRGISPLRSGSPRLSSYSAGQKARPVGINEYQDVSQWIGWQPKGPSTESPVTSFSTLVDNPRGMQEGLAPHNFQAIPLTPSPLSTSPSNVLPSPPGTILRSGRYRLGELRERQDWSQGIFEAIWVSYDTQKGLAPVTIYELELPQMASSSIQSALQQAAMVLRAIGGHRRIPSLLDAFSERGRAFFVFEAYKGESLLARMRASGGVIAERHVIDCCLQMTEVLELLRQQFPPLVHGNIRPEHIVLVNEGWQCAVTTFSVILAMQTAQLISGGGRAQLSPYMAPELARGVIDPRSDLYALMATAYHVVTGSLPTTGRGQTILPARQVNANVSPQFEAILMKGLQPLAENRYQRVSELRHDLLAIQVAGRTSTNLVPDFQIPLAIAPAGKDENDRPALLPAPEALPAMSSGNDTSAAAVWLSLILICIIVLVLASQVLTPG